MNGLTMFLSVYQGRILFLVFLLLAGSPIIYATAAGLKLFKVSRSLQYKLLTRVAFVLLGIGLSCACSLIAQIDPVRAVNGKLFYPTWFAWWFWIGEACRWLPSSVLSWFIMYPESDSGKL